MSSVGAVKLWIWLSVFASCAGWLLSFFGSLTVVGYLVLGAVTLIALNELANRGLIERAKFRFQWNPQKLRRRFRRPFPLMFLSLAALVLISGILYPPTNHTGLSYRITRVLNWMAEDQWHWIYAPNYRMNNRACGIEWMSAPLLMFFRSDRLLFLLNYIPFLLMPGLTFSMLNRLGVRGRVAEFWMWILPTGYVFLLQAGSIGNDAFPVVYAMAAVDFACRAWKSQRVNDLWYSGLSIALLTGAKASNLPLCLMWLVLIAPLWKLMKQKPIGTSAVVVLALFASVLPTIVMNLWYCHSWSGLNLEKKGMDMANPIVGLWGNPILLAVNNLCPPFFPMAGWWNDHILGLTPAFIRDPMLNNFEIPFQQVWEIPTEDWAGIGPGVSVLMLIAAGFALRGVWRNRSKRSRNDGIPVWVWRLALVSPWIGLAAYCMKSGMVTPGRLIAPYYPLLLPALVLGAEQSILIRKKWWRGLAWVIFLLAFGVLIVTPPRPLWPAQTILTKLQASHPDNRIFNRALTTYKTYAIRNDPLEDLRAKLPPDLKTIGMVITPDDLDYSFWRPIGKRKVAHISANDEDYEKIKARQLEYAVVSGLHFQLENIKLDEWLAKTHGEIIATNTVTITVSTGPQDWYLVHFKDQK